MHHPPPIFLVESLGGGTVDHLRRIAIHQDNPSKSIRNMYDTIVAKIDSGTDLQAGFEQEAVVLARRMIDDLFLSLGEALEHRHDE